MGTGLFWRGYRNSLDLIVDELDLTLPRLPQAFKGFRVLFMSDLHFGEDHRPPKIIADKTRGMEVDLLLLGGDYRTHFSDPYLPSMELLRVTLDGIKVRLAKVGVLGNHDCPEMVPYLEDMGVTMLLNGSVAIEKGRDVIHVVGTEDSHDHRRHDVERAFARVPKGQFRLFLAHSPDLFHEAAERSADLYLCGHTHNGQIRLPWFGSVFTNSSAPRKFTGGLWRHEDMLGYTGSGSGTSLVPVRFLCPPQVSLFTLHGG
jgi:predicted MPP superfamily phosphohydrolase